jgi:hypothetical protein
MAVSLTAAKFKPLILSVSGFTLSYADNMIILLILYDLCLLSAQFCYIIMYICIYERLKAVCKSQTGVHLGKFPLVQKTSFVGAAIVRGRCLLLLPRQGKGTKGIFHTFSVR